MPPGIASFRWSTRKSRRRRARPSGRLASPCWCSFCPTIPVAQVYGAAAATQQAMNVYRAACKMVEQNPLLKKRLRILRGTNRIVKRNDPDSFYAAIAADGDFGDGVNPSCVIADEVHCWKTKTIGELGRVDEWWLHAPPDPDHLHYHRGRPIGIAARLAPAREDAKDQRRRRARPEVLWPHLRGIRR